MKLIPIALLASLTACTGSLESARQTGMYNRPTGARPELVNAYCRKVDSQETFWGGTTVGAAALSGAAGLSTIPLGDDPEAQTAMAITAASVATVGAFSAYVQRRKASTWARECSER